MKYNPQMSVGKPYNQISGKQKNDNGHVLGATVRSPIKQVYTENKKEDSLEETAENSKELEEISNKNRLNRPKARVRTKPSRMDSAAFTKLGFLIINIITFSLLITMAILLKK